MRAVQHSALHRNLNAHLRAVTLPNGTIVNMMPSRTNRGVDIRALPKSDRLRALSQFYRSYNGGKYFKYFQDELRAMSRTVGGLDPALFQ